MSGALAVFDLGKTNSKLFVFAPDGTLLDERRTKPVWKPFRGRNVLDDDRLFSWMRTELAEVVAAHDVGGMTVSAHGCAFALVRGTELLHPILDYEQEIPQPTAKIIDPMLPDYSETYTPWLPLGFSIARHIYWLATEEPQTFAATEAILCYPQYWGWRFAGRPLAEWSYLGAHSQLWAPLKRDFSSLVDRLGWREKFSEIAPAGAVIGEARIELADGTSRSISVHNGVHDSNAALAYYRMTGLTGFTLVSTGTWVIIINLDCPLGALDRERDMIANVTVDGEPAPSLRFMGGREYDLISDGWNRPISQEAVERVMARGIFAMPSWAAGGPFPEIRGHIVGGEVEGEERAAVAALYVLMMTDLSLDLIHSDNLLVVDGGLAKIDLLTAMLAQLRHRQTVVHSTTSEGSATGAAALAFKALGRSPFRDETVPIAASEVSGLETYRDRWRELADRARAAARAELRSANGVAGVGA
ncbi:MULTISPECIES: FGGY family carbohydrate kinase [Phyllobacteriaceae]|jgi:sugar (pentulose or hexulose) kinase|uniref:Carbohydrate kinase n=1 Tax=Mesorhizobium hungaricum TaxID=1566387 RepID=A0A1C2DVM9_9HYPH|nr:MULTISPECIES: FGGY family carbohydrate kinase [Mesorhizobium]MBN9234036.1 carbohydrate kinase [Mesorhizobium sp.]MDQ0331568.1 sugar (pentulose or hexulose) kinase [Mesorhizobium sp. YL-MeA3-2017]OCX18807.1 carbohydrate kinase [Mesorhizobium hungaricum]